MMIPAFHQGRREALNLQQGDVVFVIGEKEYTRNNDNTFPFRQSSSMHYLTGFDEPDSCAILEKDRFTLIVPKRDKEMEIWNGRRAGVEGAQRDYKADEAYTTDQLDSVVQRVCRSAERVFFVDDTSNSELRKKIEQQVIQSIYDPRSFNDQVNTLRMIKSYEEIEHLRKANEISCAGHIAAMKQCKGATNECQIRAALEKVFVEKGSERLGYPSIVAAGANGTILHYPDANGAVKPGDLILIDAGGEYNYYTADVTRTWPISGKFNPEQRAIYQIVYDAQEACIQSLKPGITLQELHELSVKVITEGLTKLGIFKEGMDIRQFYPHSIGHYLGLDVHDVSGSCRKQIPLAPGMVITVEPGIYIQEDDETVDPKWRGIGVRIEDNLLITFGSYVNLTTAPRSIDEIEAVMADNG